MTPSNLQYPLREWMTEIVPKVFETMASVPATATPPNAAPRHSAGVRVSGAIGIVGESITGTVYLHLTLSLAREITRSLLGAGASEEPSDPEINDLVGEFCNMIGGKLKSTLTDEGTRCAMSPPSIIRGSAFAIESMPNAYLENIQFDCLTHRFSVEIHLHPQDP